MIDINSVNDYYKDKESKSLCNKCITNLIQCVTCLGYFKYEFYFTKHEDLCKKLLSEFKEKEELQRCENCSCLLLKSHMRDHLFECKSKTIIINCQFCSKSFPKEFIENHEKSCLILKNQINDLEAKAQCQFCKEELNLTLLIAHEEECFNLKKQKDEVDKKLNLLKNKIEHPKNWTYYALSDMIDDNLWMVNLNKNSDEFDRISEIVYTRSHNRFFRCKIDNIFRVQNNIVYERFIEEKDKLEKEKGFTEIKELFYGCTNQPLLSIDSTGFDISYAKDSEPFGRGIHFYNQSEEAAKRYGGKKVVLYLCDVLIGKVHVKEKLYDSSIRKPPYFDAKNYIYYDSISNLENFDNDYNRMQIFSVYNNEKAYPHYKIELTLIN